MTRKNITAVAIADKIGVSRSTVVHILNRTPGLKFSKKTCQQVIEAAENLGYQRALLARSIKRPLKQIGIAVGETYSGPSRYNEELMIFEGIRTKAIENGYVPIIQALPTKQGQENSMEAVKDMAQTYYSRLVDGFILDKVSFATQSIVYLQERNIPIVTVNGQPFVMEGQSEKPFQSVNVDTLSGGRQAGEHLLSLGHRRIALITQPCYSLPRHEQSFQIRGLTDGFGAALNDLGLPLDPLHIFEANPSDVFRIVKIVEQLLSMTEPPTAIFATDDALAVMTINSLKQRDKDVPRDISVLGCGDFSPAVYLSPCPLSTIHCPYKENGSEAMRLLIDIIEGRKPRQPQLLLQTKLVCRNSTSPPP